MWLPLEIQIQVLHQIAETLPWEDVSRATLVSKFFNDEIIKAILKSPRLESEGLGFIPREPGGKAERAQYASVENGLWKKFPYRLKRWYLHHKLEIHSHSPCVWSIFVQCILDLPNERTTSQETDILINKLIDAWTCGKFASARDLLDPTRCEEQMEKWKKRGSHSYLYNQPEAEPFEETLNLALATSAIVRKDYSELQRLLDQGVNLGQPSVRFANVPLHTTCAKGTKELTELLIANNCPVQARGVYKIFPAFSVIWYHAKRGHRETLETWINHLKKTAPLSLPPAFYKFHWHGLRTSWASENIELVEFIDDQCGHYLNREKFRLSLFIAIIPYKGLEEIQRLFDKGGFDINMSTGMSDNHTVLLAALDAPNLTGRPMETIIPVIRFLLEKGANPDGLPTVNRFRQRTPFTTAIENGNVEAAILLVEYGATVDLDSVRPSLLQDTEHDWTRLIELLQSDRVISELAGELQEMRNLGET